MIWNISKLSASHLSCAAAIFFVDCCQFGPNWMFGLKMELMACAELVGSTTEQRCLFTDIIWYYQWYETLMNCLNYTSAMTQPFLMLIAANLAQVWRPTRNTTQKPLLFCGSCGSKILYFFTKIKQPRKQGTLMKPFNPLDCTRRLQKVRAGCLNFWHEICLLVGLSGGVYCRT